jgi:hypothetical protein
MSSRQFLMNTKLVVSKQFSLLKEKVESLESNGIMLLWWFGVEYLRGSCDVIRSAKAFRSANMKDIVAHVSCQFCFNSGVSAFDYTNCDLSEGVLNSENTEVAQ